MGLIEYLMFSISLRRMKQQKIPSGLSKAFLREKMISKLILVVVYFYTPFGLVFMNKVPENPRSSPRYVIFGIRESG